MFNIIDTWKYNNDITYGNSDDCRFTFSNITNYEKLMTVCFFATIFAILLKIPGANILKYTVLPLSMIMLYSSDLFEYLLYPIAFSENMIGTLILGKFTLLWIFFLFLLVKWTCFQKKEFIMTKLYFAIFVWFSFYQFLAFGDYGNNSIKSIIYIFFVIIIAQECQEDIDKYDKIFWIILMSSLVQALTLAFSLTGETIEVSERTTGVGFTDPNYASFMVLLGFCVLLNGNFKTLLSKILQVAGCLLCCLAVFRSGSRSGMITYIVILCIKLLLLKGIKKKVGYLFIVITVSLIVILLISSGKIKIPGYESIIERLIDLSDKFQAGDLNGATADRTEIATRYFKYCFSRNPISILLGGTIVASSSLVAQIGAVTHNSYLDYLIAFGMIGVLFFFGVFIKRIWDGFSIYLETMDINMLVLTEIKICMLILCSSLAMLQVNLWWFLFLL